MKRDPRKFHLANDVTLVRHRDSGVGARWYRLVFEGGWTVDVYGEDIHDNRRYNPDGQGRQRISFGSPKRGCFCHGQVFIPEGAVVKEVHLSSEVQIFQMFIALRYAKLVREGAEERPFEQALVGNHTAEAYGQALNEHVLRDDCQVVSTEE